MTTTTQPTVRLEQAAQVVGLLARGNGIVRVAAKTRLPEGLVRHIGQLYGYPDLGVLEQASKELQAALGGARATEWEPIAKAPRQPANPTPKSARKATPAAATTPPATSSAEDNADLSDLINQARAIGGRLAGLADEAQTAVDNLLAGLDLHAKQATIRARISELEDEIARLRDEIGDELALSTSKPEHKPVAAAPKPARGKPATTARFYPEGTCSKGHNTADTGRYKSTKQCCECVRENGAVRRAAKKGV